MPWPSEKHLERLYRSSMGAALPTSTRPSSLFELSMQSTLDHLPLEAIERKRVLDSLAPELQEKIRRQKMLVEHDGLKCYATFKKDSYELTCPIVDKTGASRVMARRYSRVNLIRPIRASDRSYLRLSIDNSRVLMRRLSGQVEDGFYRGMGPRFAHDAIVRPMLAYINGTPLPGQPAFDPTHLRDLWYMNHGSRRLYDTFIPTLIRCFDSTQSISDRIRAATQLQADWDSNGGNDEPFDTRAMGVPLNRRLAFDLSQQFVRPLVELLHIYIAVSGVKESP